MNTKPIDIVIPLGTITGTPYHKNVEIKFNYLLIKKYLTGYRNIYIIGEKPDFEGDYIHIPHEQDGWNKEVNIKRKIEAACINEDISENFFFENDDYVYLQEIDVRNFPFYYDGNLERAVNRKRKVGNYRAAIQNTLDVLRVAEKPTNHFDIHVPIIYNKKMFLSAMSQYNWKKKSAYIIKSLYCNTNNINGELLQDCLIGYSCESKEQIYKETAGRFMFAYNEYSMNNDVMLSFIEEIIQR